MTEPRTRLDTEQPPTDRTACFSGQGSTLCPSFLGCKMGTLPSLPHGVVMRIRWYSYTLEQRLVCSDC